MFDSISVAARGTPSALVVARFKDKPLHASIKPHDPDGAAAEAIKRPESTGDLNNITHAFPKASKGKNPPRLIILGLGDQSKLKPSSFRDLGAALAKAASAIKATHLQLDLAGPIKDAKLDEGACASALAEGFGLMAWNYDTLRGSATTKPTRTKVALSSASKAFTTGLTRGLGLADAANLARDLSQTPPNIATPLWMAAEAQKLARSAGLKCTVYKGPQLDSMGLIGCKVVGDASENKPCMVRLEYTPKNAGKKSKPVVLIGKTMTYDTGGLSLKVNNGMKGMKRDKDGGCAVIGAMHAIANTIKPRQRVVALLMCAENSISDEAYRPDDVITYANGVTVEVTNTDAEGRLVLADGLIHACKKEDPAAIIDLATLTGGVVVALGSVFAGLFCEDDKLRTQLEDAGTASGERLWRLPMDDLYRDMMKSPVADIVNSAPVREAHPIQGAAFLSYFVDEGTPWAHIDIAGVHEASGPRGPFIAGPTGFGVRLLAEFFEQR